MFPLAPVLVVDRERSRAAPKSLGPTVTAAALTQALTYMPARNGRRGSICSVVGLRTTLERTAAKMETVGHVANDDPSSGLRAVCVGWWLWTTLIIVEKPINNPRR
jgi:hypothetical protein